MHAVPTTLRIPQPGASVQELHVDLVFSDGPSTARFKKRADLSADGDSWLALTVTNLCIARLIEQCLDLNKQEIFAYGEIVSDNVFDSKIDKLFHTLRSYSGGCTVHREAFTMLIYPSGQQDWDFLKSPKAGPGIRLQFVVMPPIQPMALTKEIAQSADVAEPVWHEESPIITLDHDRLFHAGSRERSVYLLFHPHYQQEIEVLMKSLHAVGATVFLSSEPNSWLHFTTKCESGTIIVSSIHVYEMTYAERSRSILPSTTSTSSPISSRS